MITHHSALKLEVTGHGPAKLQGDLNTAEGIVRSHAMMDQQHGILVTRHSYTNFIVALSPEVPYGETHERHAIQDRS